MEADWQNLNNQHYQVKVNSEDAEAFYVLVLKRGDGTLDKARIARTVVGHLPRGPADAR